MHVNHSVDWLRWTVDGIGNPPLDVLFDAAALERVATPIRAIAPYKSAIRLMAASMFWHVDRPELKTMVEMTGGDCEVAREIGSAPETMLAGVRGSLGTVTRIDLAIDVYEGGRTPYQAFLWRRSGRMQTRAKDAKFVRGLKGGEVAGDTLYIGSRHSERYIRIYDKAAEMGLQSDWVRVEMELKGRTAARAAEMVQSRGVVAAARAYAGDSISMDNQWWKDVLGTEPLASPPRVARKETDGMTWLIDVVLPRLERALLFEDTSGNLRAGIDAMLERVDNNGY